MTTPRDRVERALAEIFATPALSLSVRRVADARLPGPLLRAMIRAWVSAYGVDMAESARAEGEFETFNDFFTRALKPGIRPIDPREDVLVCPADATLRAIGAIPSGGRVAQLKGRSWAIDDLLGDPAQAERLSGGFALLYLSPGDYHRVHLPVAGQVSAVRTLRGSRYPVNRLGERAVDGLYAANERVVTTLTGTPFGELAAVMVGATNVSRITLSLAAGDAVDKGAELGAFNLGSAVVLLSERPFSPLLSPGAATRVGQPLAQRA